MVLTENETCSICGKKIGREEKGCVYVLEKGYMHFSCNTKWRIEQVELMD